MNTTLSPPRTQGSLQQSWKKDCKSKRWWMAAKKWCFLNTCRLMVFMTRHTRSVQCRTTAWREDVQLIAKELLVIDSCWERESIFSRLYLGKPNLLQDPYLRTFRKHKLDSIGVLNTYKYIHRHDWLSWEERVYFWGIEGAKLSKHGVWNS